ncbi:MAG TPA: rRNA maturation RNase YbeY [Acidimicrobiia bacterium]|nr:rRNA maturation RNase YbeY [Acidimicrobiia bacterium]
MNVFFSDEQDREVDTHSLRAFAETVVAAEGYGPETELSVMLVDPDQMSEYNRRFMGRSGATDVLAFPLEELTAGAVPPRLADEPPVVLGDVFLCPVEIEKRARRERLDFDSFLHLLLAHGILHLLGYDHAEDAAADLMERREEELLALIGRTI